MSAILGTSERLSDDEGAAPKDRPCRVTPHVQRLPPRRVSTRSSAVR